MIVQIHHNATISEVMQLRNEQKKKCGRLKSGVFYHPCDRHFSETSDYPASEKMPKAVDNRAN